MVETDELRCYRLIVSVIKSVEENNYIGLNNRLTNITNLVSKNRHKFTKEKSYSITDVESVWNVFDKTSANLNMINANEQLRKDEFINRVIAEFNQHMQDKVPKQ